MYAPSLRVWTRIAQSLRSIIMAKGTKSKGGKKGQAKAKDVAKSPKSTAEKKVREEKYGTRH